ncbi:MAG TPA: protein-disulfide reductase DsbD domain-containing protein [Alphaproteobacteria bacterium]
MSATAAAGEAATLRLGLEFKLEPGWKIYWRSPGDAGLPPKLDWAGSRNLADAAIRWPAPERFELFGFDTFGYGGDVVLPIDARVEHPGAPLALRLAVDYLVCEKICIPYQASFRLDLPAGAASPTDYAHAIDQFVARVPGDGSGAGLSIDRASWSGGENPAVTVVATATTPFEHPDLFVEGALASGVGFGKPDVNLSDGGRRAILRLPARFERPEAAAAANFAGTPVTLTLVDGARAMEKGVTLAAGLPGPVPMQVGFGAILLAALLGGLVLNLMPCVLPVLSLKLLNLVSHAGLARTRIRRNFLAAAAGILTAFLILALALVALKAAGSTIGWGIQFQQPEFLVFMGVVLTLFTANLWGWFELRLPGIVSDAVVGAGGEAKAPHEESAVGAFLSGAFATLLATPCSAPFVGTAVGFALARGAVDIVTIFLALGLGLALPYLVIALLPGLAARLPRPGSWMVKLRFVLGFALAATAVWLLSVLAVQISPEAAAAVGLVLLALLAVLWAVHRAAGWRSVGWIAAVGLAILAFVVPQRFAAQPPPPETSALAGAAWRPFELADVESLVREGHVVFVDVTADWCITCQVNKAAVVSRGEVAARLANGSVVPMRADWTRPNDVIARYLASFGRYGIPFNVVYGPAAPSGIPLPEILTTDVVLAALDKAEGRKTTAAADKPANP